MSYTKEDYRADIDWLMGYDITEDEAEQFIKSLLRNGFIMDKKEYIALFND